MAKGSFGTWQNHYFMKLVMFTAANPWGNGGNLRAMLSLGNTMPLLLLYINIPLCFQVLGHERNIISTCVC